MTPLELIVRELVRVRGCIASLQTEHDELEAALRVIRRLTPPEAKAEPPRVFKMELHAEPPAEPECKAKISAPVCVECGGPRSQGSASKCRSCFVRASHAEQPQPEAKAEPEPECIIDVSRAPALAEAVDALRESTAAGPELLARVREEARNRGLTISACSREIFGNGSQLYSLKDGRERDMSRARQWLAGPSDDHQNAFQAQVERVARGEVGIAENVHIPRRGVPDGTLGGVTGEINL